MKQSKPLKDLLKDFKLREDYSSKKISDCLGYKRPSQNTPVSRSDGMLLFVNLAKKIEGDTERKNKLGNSLLSWVGQARHNSDQRIVDAAKQRKKIFLFCRHKRPQNYTYYGPINLVDYELHTGKEPSYFDFSIEEPGIEERSLKSITPDPDFLCTQRDTQGTVRVGQSRFRERVLKLWEEACSVTRLKNSKRLNLWASHIKPWRDCSNKERLDHYNGLLLMPNLERLFDSGFITFEKKSGKIIISSKLTLRQQKILCVHPKMKLWKVPPKSARYLEYHRENLFENWKATALRQP